MSLLDVALLPMRVGRHVATAIITSPLDASGLIVINGMAEGVRGRR